MKKKLIIDKFCDSCGGTGLYVGYAEHDGAAVVCHTCKGDGHYKQTISWTPWLKSSKRKRRDNVERVFLTNPGIGIGRGPLRDGSILKLEDFGGAEYDKWLDLGKKAFHKGSEMRKYTCPAWWYQSTDYDKKPDWNECIGCGSFSECKNYKTKHLCWDRFDKYGKKGK